MTYREDGREDRSILVTAFSGSIFGLDPATGAVRWRHALGDGTIELQFRAGRVFASTSQVLYCFEYPSGVPLGRVQIPDQYGGRPTMLIEGDRIFLGTHGELSCFDLTGKVLWAQPFQGQGFGSMALGFPNNVRQADDVGSR
jgi:outer membrane protein assembly factor BamB